VNFITCHDGFTLRDLVSYNGKHNEANGEGNRDGANDNEIWNCGWEGPSTDPAVNNLRLRQSKNAFAMVLLSRGVPMLLAGDEMGHTQKGNNNAYCQDNELSWLNWDMLKQHGELFEFVKHCIAFRKAHPALRDPEHPGAAHEGTLMSWHGTRPWNADWSGTSRTLAFMLHGRPATPLEPALDFIYVALNMHWETHWFDLPQLNPGTIWHVAINTGATAPEDKWPLGHEPALAEQNGLIVGEHSVVVLVGR
jgi:glycogen operon protein